MKARILIVAMFLFGCAGVSEQQKQVASSQHQVNLNQCGTLLKGYQTGVNSYIDYAHCTNNARTQYFTAIDFPYPEIVPLANTYNLALAERVQAGEITPEQALRMDNQFGHELIAQAYQQRRAAAERELAWRSLIRSLNNTYYLSRPITCFQNGPFITCN